MPQAAGASGHSGAANVPRPRDSDSALAATMALRAACARRLTPASLVASAALAIVTRALAIVARAAAIVRDVEGWGQHTTVRCDGCEPGEGDVAGRNLRG